MKNIDYENYGQYLIDENIRLFTSICEKEALLKIAEKEKELLQTQIVELSKYMLQH